MSVHILKINSYKYVPGGQDIVADFVVDTVTDLPGVNDLSGYTLQLGCTAIVVQDSTFYRMMSGGSWVQQLHDNNADVYTKNQVNTLLTTKQNLLTFDATPTQSSTNPVESGGVYSMVLQYNYFRYGAMIPEYDDMDNYTSPGVYYVGSAANASNIAHTPVNLAARVEVMPLWGTGRGVQKYYVYTGGVVTLYMRGFNTALGTPFGSWYKWEGVLV